MSKTYLRPRNRRRVAKLAALLLAGVMGGTVWWAARPFRSGAQSPGPEAVGIHKVEGAVWRPEQGDLLFVGVLGSDNRSGPPNAGGGCDAVHIVAINPQLRAGTILNFPRDSYLEGRKLTDICRSAGFAAGVDVLRRHTGLPIHFWAQTEFSNFMALIDALGGIEVNVPQAMNDWRSGAFFSPGPTHMLGGHALAFTRNRYDAPGGDFGRTTNQGVLIQAALQKFRNESTDPHRIFDYVKVARRHTTLDLPIGDLIKLAWLAREIDPAAMVNVTVPGSTGSAGAASVVFLSPGDTYDRVRSDAIY